MNFKNKAFNSGMIPIILKLRVLRKCGMNKKSKLRLVSGNAEYLSNALPLVGVMP